MSRLFWLLSLFGLAVGQPGSALWEYVHRDDGMYSYTEIDVIVQNGITSYVYNMTSQNWIDETYTNKPTWYHYVTIHIPDVLNDDFLNHAFIYVGTGSWDDNPPDAGSRHVEETGIYANRTGMVTGVIKQVPFQPIRFIESSGIEKSEDAIIAFTWAEFLESDGTTNPEQLARFPMCKAVSKAMDTMQAVAADKTGGRANIQGFMVAGESKRGWTTWMMPPADDRIEAFAPVVLSCLNMNTNFHHYWKSFGGWTFLFAEYYVQNITVWLDHPNVFLLEDYIDPITYKDTMTMPKMMVSGASDEFFMPDDYDYFFNDLPGEKYIWLLENTGHSISSSPLNAEYWRQLETFYIAVIKNRPRPSFTWERFVEASGSGYIQVYLDEPADSVVAWKADTPPAVAPRRDFRTLMRGFNGTGEVETNVTWHEFPATNVGGNVWRVEFDKPNPPAFRCFYLKMTFPYPEEGRTFTFTSEAIILSHDENREFPFDDCTGVECYGTLV